MRLITYSLTATTRDGRKAVFDPLPLRAGEWMQEGFRVTVSGGDPVFSVRVTPPSPLACVVHRISLPLRNFHHVICPDSGRTFPQYLQMLTFWGTVFRSSYADVKVPLFLFTGQDHGVSLAFGVAGQDCETECYRTEPPRTMTLQAHTGRLGMAIARGTEQTPLPEELTEPDGSLEEQLFLFDLPEDGGSPWPCVLRQFAEITRGGRSSEPPPERAALDPVWCSWRSVPSAGLTQQQVEATAATGLDCGIRNYIVDDGWFGPGLDSDASVPLRYGDWLPDTARFPSLPALADQLHERGGRLLLWCAPHVATPLSDAYRTHAAELLCNTQGEPVRNAKGLSFFCPRCVQARERMAQRCVQLLRDAHADGLKLDLFNLFPAEPCASRAHEHDTGSGMAALRALLAAVSDRVHREAPHAILELKQNYGWVFLAPYGQLMRAGDTPYDPEENFLRTAFISAYTPAALNDYQAVTAADSPTACAQMILKMMAVGVPAYCAPLAALPEPHRRVLRFLHAQYQDLLAQAPTPWRTPLTNELDCWYVPGAQEDFYFLINAGAEVVLQSSRPFRVLNGSYQSRIRLLGAAGRTGRVFAADGTFLRTVACEPVACENVACDPATGTTVVLHPAEIVCFA